MTRRKTPAELRLCPALGFSQIVGGKYKLRILSRELQELQQRGLIVRRKAH